VCVKKKGIALQKGVRKELKINQQKKGRFILSQRNKSRKRGGTKKKTGLLHSVEGSIRIRDSHFTRKGKEKRGNGHMIFIRVWEKKERTRKKCDQNRL